MKMTMHIDEALLKRVMDTYELETKTDAVEFALRELDRKARLKKFMKEGLGLTAEEMREGIYPGYNPDDTKYHSMVAEDPKPYGRPD
jgi:hypothetical protein